jgi:demethylmenaquinone methyltransferase/2-methoxy-6-polyprenyl-1,4-benzoquinol methylase
VDPRVPSWIRAFLRGLARSFVDPRVPSVNPSGESGAPVRKNGPVTRASLNKQPHEVASMFDDVAERYDLTNDVLSLGQDRVWRKAVAGAVDARPAQKVLDLAAGTATSSLPFARTGAYVVPCDFSLGMLRVGKSRHSWLPFTAGDATRLPFKDDVFDAVTISFGLRNVQDTDAALREMYRVTRPGGRVVICEFSHPTWAPFRTVYTEYLMRALPPVARAVSSNPDAYVYLAESIRAWPDQPALAERLQQAGWSKVAWRDLTGGIVALHRGFKPGGQ